MNWNMHMDPELENYMLQTDSNLDDAVNELGLTWYEIWKVVDEDK
ncbi:hypothetical protein [Ornithinibacillus halophilus]|uniref:Uncharacterized protein n=1 Tax=Ornithinibacillus halophilus TaxID=930117 RepID=A0A1M5LMN6_9BACI|nr:hypothetical protein [Ornithinibacillus halophilus]SHG65583.1 hypothetical protein SAMN05216225_104813 [Ornithinibacillus halophilus]